MIKLPKRLVPKKNLIEFAVSAWICSFIYALNFFSARHWTKCLIDPCHRVLDFEVNGLHTKTKRLSHIQNRNNNGDLVKPKLRLKRLRKKRSLKSISFNLI